MTSTMLHRAIVGACAICALGACAGSAGAFVDLQGRGSGRLVRGGSTTFLENDPGFDAFFPDDTTGIVAAQNFHLLGEGEALSMLSGSALGAGAAASGVSLAPVDNFLYAAFGSANVRYRDELTVTSATLPAGTPVQVMFSFDLAHTIFSQSSFGNGGADTRRGRADADLAVGLVSSDFASGTIDTAYLLSNDHKAIKDTGYSINIAQGIFASGHVDLYLDATVGAKIDVSITLDVSAIINVVEGNGANTNAQGYINAGIAFGATGLTPARNGIGDIQLASALLAGPFPDASQATPHNAAAAMPSVPAPSVLLVIVLAGWSPVLRRRRA